MRGVSAPVLFDRPKDARPPEWVLDETHVVDVEVVGRAHEGALTHFVAPLELVAEDAMTLWQDELALFLRARGLYLGDGTMTFYEAVLPSGAQCGVAVADDRPSGAILVAGGASP